MAYLGTYLFTYIDDTSEIFVKKLLIFSDLQFQLIFSKESKESSPTPSPPPNEENLENNEVGNL